jgi:hypothetical protein
MLDTKLTQEFEAEAVSTAKSTYKVCKIKVAIGYVLFMKTAYTGDHPAIVCSRICGPGWRYSCVVTYSLGVKSRKGCVLGNKPSDCIASEYRHKSNLYLQTHDGNNEARALLEGFPQFTGQLPG